MSNNLNMKDTIYYCLKKLLDEQNKDYASLSEIYDAVAKYKKVENDVALQSSIRGRLQENCLQYKSFIGEPLFYTKKIRSGFWSVYSEEELQKKNFKYVIHKNSEYLITDNNWLTYSSVDHVSSFYQKEINQDNVYKAHLMADLGIEKASIILEQLEEIRKMIEDHQGKKKIWDGYGQAFEVFAIATHHHLSKLEVIENYIIFGDYDGKIDAIYYPKNSDKVYIYQIKTNILDDNTLDLMKINYDKCFEDEIPANGFNLMQFVKKRKFDLENRKEIFQTISTNSKKASNITPNTIYEEFFENYFFPQAFNGLELRLDKVFNKNDVTFENNTCLLENNYLFFISAKSLLDSLLQALGLPSYSKISKKDPGVFEKYFYNNVRGNLQLNDKMQETLLKEPHNFFKYNNGISVTGQVEDQNRKILIRNPIINNGQQSIINIFMSNADLSEVRVPIKICHETDAAVIEKICRFTNDQRNIKEIDILSENEYIRQIQKVIYKRSKYFLDIISNGKKNYHSKIKTLYPSNNYIKLLDFMKLYFSVKNKNDLGNWKNNPNRIIEKLEIKENFDEELSIQVCESIRKYNDFMDDLKKDKTKSREVADFKSADLAFKYLLCAEKVSVEMAQNIILQINNQFYYDVADKKSKLIDIYKSSNIIKKIETILNENKVR